jgi:CHASE3 domain sensor protein
MFFDQGRDRLLKQTRLLAEQKPKTPLIFLIVGVCMVVMGSLFLYSTYTSYRDLRSAFANSETNANYINNLFRSIESTAPIGMSFILIGLVWIIFAAATYERIKMYRQLQMQLEQQ